MENVRSPLLLQNLHHRLLDHPIPRRRNAQFPHSSVRLRDFHPLHRLRFVAPTQQLLPNDDQFAIVGKFIDGDAIDSRATLIGLDLPDGFLQVSPFTYRLHHSFRVGRAFGFMCRRKRFELSLLRPLGFTPLRH